MVVPADRSRMGETIVAGAATKPVLAPLKTLTIEQSLA